MQEKLSQRPQSFNTDTLRLQQELLKESTPQKDFEHFKAHTREIVLENQLRNIIFQNKNEMNAINQITEYLIKKTGSPKNALEELKRIQATKILNPFSNSRFGLNREIIRHANKTKVPKESKKEYVKQTSHIISEAHQEIIGILEIAEMDLEKMIQKNLEFLQTISESIL